MPSRSGWAIVAVIMVLSLLSCAGRRPDDLGPRQGRLKPCPSSPNCVCSDDEDPTHGIAPMTIDGSPEAAWATAREVVASLPRTVIVREEDGYLHAECTSAILGFTDDLELQLRPEAGSIAVRSASRLGYGDLGVNRARVETVRTSLIARGAVRP